MEAKKFDICNLQIHDMKNIINGRNMYNFTHYETKDEKGEYLPYTEKYEIDLFLDRMSYFGENTLRELIILWIDQVDISPLIRIENVMRSFHTSGCGLLPELIFSEKEKNEYYIDNKLSNYLRDNNEKLFNELFNEIKK